MLSLACCGILGKPPPSLTSSPPLSYTGHRVISGGLPVSTLWTFDLEDLLDQTFETEELPRVSKLQFLSHTLLFGHIHVAPQ